MRLRRSVLSKVVCSSIFPVRNPFPSGRNKPDAEFLEQWQYLRFGALKPKRIFALDRGYRLNGMRPANRLCRRLRHSKVLHLAFLNQLLDGSCHLFNRDLGIYPVLIEKIDTVDSKSFERVLDALFDVLRPAVHPYIPWYAVLLLVFEPNFVAITT